jgi:ATP-dependent helicase HepA
MSAQNTYLIPPDWEKYFAKKQNAAALRVREGYEQAEQHKNVSSRTIKGTFDRSLAIKNDFIHFFAPGDEIYDCIINNALHSYHGKCTAFAIESDIEWMGLIFTFSAHPNYGILFDAGMTVNDLGSFRQFLSSVMLNFPYSLEKSNEKVPFAEVQKRILRIEKYRSLEDSAEIEHLGRRGRKKSGFLCIPEKYGCSNLEKFQSVFPQDGWKSIVEKIYSIAEKQIIEAYRNRSNFEGARETAEQMLASEEADNSYYHTNHDIEAMKKKYQTILDSLENFEVKLESAAFVWLKKQ